MDRTGSPGEFEIDGRRWFRAALSDAALGILDKEIQLDGRAGARVGPTSGLMAVLSDSGELGRLMQAFEGGLLPVRIVAFDKTGAANWSVPWHQDRVIAVKDRHAHSEFQNWSEKGGVWHCEPPRGVLERMYFVRVHLDDNAPEDGSMRIAIGSHRSGIVPSADAAALALGLPQEDCVAARGDVLVLKMLMLHASSASATRNPRRVLRVDYAPGDLLPEPLTWI